MISVIYKKSDYLKTLKYVLGKNNMEVVNTNMGTSAPTLLNKQFLAVAHLNEAVKRRCTHIIISNAAQENISNVQYHQITRDFLHDLGYLPDRGTSLSTSQFIAVRHHDRDHEHIHIVTSRVQHNGKSVSDSFDYFKAEVSTTRISAQLGLEIIPVSNSEIARRLKEEFKITVEVNPERQKSIKLIHHPHKTPTSKQVIRKAITEAVIDSPPLSTFIKRLEEHDVAVLPKTQANKLVGLTYIHKDVKIAGYQVYKPYSWTKLQSEYGLTYDKQKDSEFIERTRAKAIKTLSSYSNSNVPVLGMKNVPEPCQFLELSIQTSIPGEVKNEDQEKVEASCHQVFNQLATKAIPNALASSKHKQHSKIVKQPLAETSQKQLITPIPAQLSIDNSQELPSIIIDYMLVVNKKFIEGRKLRAKLDKNVLQVCRVEGDIPVMQMTYLKGQWNEQINILTTDEIKQIQHLQILTQQKLTNTATQLTHNKTKLGIEMS